MNQFSQHFVKTGQLDKKYGRMLALVMQIRESSDYSPEMSVSPENAAAIIADAQCTKVCVYMSVVLLIASAAYELTGIAYVDILGSLGLAYLSFNEGRECFEKAKSDKLCSCEDENLTREARPEVPTVTDLK